MVDSHQAHEAMPVAAAAAVPAPSLPAALPTTVLPSEQPTEASSHFSSSLIQSLLQLSSQQVQHIHSSIHFIAPQSTDDDASAAVWHTAEQTALTQRAEQRARAQPQAASVPSSPPVASPPIESSSLLSPDAFSSASFTYAQLCHDMPMLTVDGLTALTSGVQLHIAQQTLPAAFFSLNLPFLYQLLQQCSHIAHISSSTSDLSAAVSSLYFALLFSLFPLLLSSPLPSLRSFLSPLPASLSSSIQSLHSLQQHQLHTVPAFYVSSDELHPQHESREEKTLDDEDDATFVFEADVLSDEEQEQQQQQQQQAAAVISSEDEAAGWREAEGRLCQLLELWSADWLLGAEQSMLPSVLLQLHAVASQHRHMFLPGSRSSLQLRHHVGRLLSSLLVTSPSLLASCLPGLLSSVLGVTSISIDALQPSQPVSSEHEEEERTALLLLSSLCSTASPPSVSSFLFRLLDRNLLWLSSFSAVLASAPSVSSSRWHRSVNAVVAIATFYLFHHPGNRSGREDGGRELVACGLLSDLLSLQPLLPVSFSSPLFAFLCSASALSPAIAFVLRSDLAYRSWMQTAAAGKELVLSPVFLSLQLYSGREETAVEVRRKPKSLEQKPADGGNAPASTVSAGKKGKKKLLVAALVEVEQEGKVEETAGTQDSGLLSLLHRSEEQMRAAVHSAFPAASSAAAADHSLQLVNDVVAQLNLLCSAAPAFADVLRPYLRARTSPAVSPSASEERKDGQETELLLRRWGELLREVSTQCVAKLKQGGRRDEEKTTDTSSSSSSSNCAETDSERRQRAKTRQALRHTAEQQTAVLQTVLLSCKGLFGEGSKKD